MDNVIMIRLKHSNELIFSPFVDLGLTTCEKVIVEKEGKEEVGVVVNIEFPAGSKTLTNEVKILRKLSSSDEEKLIRLGELENESTLVFQGLLKDHRLPIKLIKTVASFGESKIVFYFFSEERVDFRGLVRDLAKKLRKRVELWQIDRREEARILGGLGPCGLVFCCKDFLFTPGSVSVHMAKVQGLLVSPDKISGVCGRLMCCLRYELLFYESSKKIFPDVGEKVTTPGGEGIVTGKNIFTEQVKVKLSDGIEYDFSLKEINKKIL